MSVFGDPDHLASWAGVSPGNNESAGRSRGSRTAKGNKYLKSALVQSAWAASHTKDTRLSGRYWRLVRRLGKDGKKKAAVALSHTLLEIIYCLLANDRFYRSSGPNTGFVATWPERKSWSKSCRSSATAWPRQPELEPVAAGLS